MNRSAFFFMVSITALCSSASGADTILEPFSYQEDFETRELSAWASYPPWQDTAYDQKMRVNTMVPGDPNISVVQKMIPYTNVDNYTGALKELDMYLVPGSSVSLRYYLKTNLSPEFFTIRLAAGADKKVDYTITCPPANSWEWVTVTFSDFISRNPRLAGRDRIKVNALAVLAKFPDADPAMPIYFGLDDITVKGTRAMAFRFAEPKSFKLSEWKPYIPENHYKQGDTFTLRGSWPLDAEKVSLDVRLFTDESKNVYSGDLKKKGNEWSTSFKLSFPEGLYHATLKALGNGEVISETEFTLFIAPKKIGGNHPRMLFDDEKKKWVESRINSDRFKWVLDHIIGEAKKEREDNPIESIVFDIDQFPEENWLPTLRSWSWGKIHVWRACVHYNSLAYSLHGDMEAGAYTKELLLKISKFPYWLHPWMIKRGRNIYYPLGELGMDLALGYDLIYDLLDENERKIIRSALMKNIVLGCHKGYVEDDLVTSNTSNWVAHITGGSLLCQTAMYGDGPDVAQLEPYFTGALLKGHELILNTVDRDGAYGEGYGYYAFTMFSWSQSMPVLDYVFNIDMSDRINHSYDETIWAGNIKKKYAYYFGDSNGNLQQPNNWAWLLPKHEDPLLGWYYNHMRGKENSMRNRALNEVLYETEDVPQKAPYDENPVRFFRDVGTTVFKSGWEEDDFIFVMRTGPFVNHQHLDQGSFWLSDRGSLFVEERHGSSYYTCPLYQSHYIQPISHSTILIDGNHQSQRAGDLLWHVDGLDDYAFLYQHLDGKDAAFSSGDIGRLYWGKVENMRRNVLYIKPRTLLMLDTVVPAEDDVDVTLLYQTPFLKYIQADNDLSTLTIDGNVLNVKHLHPDNRTVEAVETPHYLSTLQNQRPLEREGMLTVTARTDGIPLVIANVLTTTTGEKSDVVVEEKGAGYVAARIYGRLTVISTSPGKVYRKDNYRSDALAVLFSNNASYAVLATCYELDNGFFIRSGEEMSFELSRDNSPKAHVMKYFTPDETEVTVGGLGTFKSVSLNGTAVGGASFTDIRRTVRLTLPKGEGFVRFEVE